MPKSDGYGQSVQFPVLSDAPNMETAMQTLVNGIVPLTVMRFANANARSAAMAFTYKPVPGMITYLKAEDRWEARQADGTWLLLSDGPWQPLTFASGYIAHGGSPGWRRKAGGGIELRGRFRRSSGGNLEDDGTAIKFATLPGAVTPAATRYYIAASSRTTVSGVTRYTARIEVASNSELRYMVEASGGTGTSADPAWVSLDGITFSPAGD
ncbi:hypothetical protein [Streptomyces chryseus]|uniref:hypothetical protein n=1 Tax=Streptomyces chryseus TaxID=68186 RepID=UPI00110F9EC2|nr:hypothetical protein [Streptomyces chryseus]GGX26914.1 hypothetical protein GCM10010353_47620 [Streptomyces chryseus]